MNRSHLVYVVALLMAISMMFMVTACTPHERKNAVLEQIRKIKAKPAFPVEPIPSFEPLEQFEYPESESRRSPFKSRQTQQKPDANRPDMNRPKQPLEEFQLDALKFVGIIEEGPRRWALIQTPQGTVQRVKVGDYMGKNYGLVLQVENNALVIEERILQEGTWEKRMLTFKLSTSSVKGK